MKTIKLRLKYPKYERRYSAPNLVLVSHAFRNNSGWDVFNHLKRVNPKLKVMVYAIDGLSRKDADWIDEAIKAGFGETKKTKTSEENISDFSTGLRPIVDLSSIPSETIPHIKAGHLGISNPNK